MLPHPVIQIRPPGFLALLGLQNGGRTPDQLDGKLGASFELSDWYLRAAQINATLVSVAIPNGAINDYGATAYTCPQDEWWFVSNFSAAARLAGADTIGSWALGMQYQGSSLVVSEAAPAVAALGCSWLRATDFWAPPGSSLGAMFGTNAIAGASVMLYRGIITRLKV